MLRISLLSVACPTRPQSSTISQKGTIFGKKLLNIQSILIFSAVEHFNNQLTHTTLKNVELLKHFKISKTAPTCFGLQGNHYQGATIST